MKTISIKRMFYTMANKISHYKIHSVAVQNMEKILNSIKRIYEASILGMLMSDHTKIIESSLIYRAIEKAFSYLQKITTSIEKGIDYYKKYSLIYKVIVKLQAIFNKKLIAILAIATSLILYLIRINKYQTDISTTIFLFVFITIVFVFGLNNFDIKEAYSDSRLSYILIYIFSDDLKSFNIQWLFMIIIIVIPIMPKTISLVLIVGLCIIKLIKTLIMDRKSFKLDVIIFSMLLMYLMIIIATVTSTNVLDSIRDFVIHSVGIFAAITMITSIKNKSELNNIIVSFVYIAAFLSAYGILQYFLGIEMDAAWVDTKNNPDLSVRVYSVFGNPNILGEYLIMALPLSIVMFFTNKGIFKKIIFVGTSGVITLALLMTFSRGAWLGFGIAFLMMVILFRKELIFLMIPAGVISMFFLPDSIVNRILSIGNLGDSSNAYRIRVWKVALQMINDNFILGVGLGYLPFKVNFIKYIRTMNVYHSHNMFLETFAEMGIGGILIMIFMLMLVLKNLYKIISEKTSWNSRLIGLGIMGSLTGILVNGLTENVLYLPRIIWTFWMIIGFSGVLIKLESQDKLQMEEN